MIRVTHLRSLQAVEMAVREGSIKAAAERLGITQAALGQRIRMLEVYLGADLVMRGRSGLVPTAELERAMPHLKMAFLALEQVTEWLDFQRAAEIHIVTEPSWAELWLLPRLPLFLAEHPHVLFCVNGIGDIPLRLGAPDLRVMSSGKVGEPLFQERYAPVSGPDNPRRIASQDASLTMEGMPLLHLKSQIEPDGPPGWVKWFDTFGLRRQGQDRGVRYQNLHDALDAVRQDVGFLVCGLSLVLGDIAAGRIVMPFPPSQHLVAQNPYRFTVRSGAEGRPQFARFLEWMQLEAGKTEQELEALTMRRKQV